MPIRTKPAVSLLAVATLLGCDAERTTVPTMDGSPASAHANGLPNNGHDRLYKFNIIGVQEKNPDMTGDAGKRMFVKLEGPSKIYLQKGEEFDILDANATDANGGKFQLPIQTRMATERPGTASTFGRSERRTGARGSARA